MSLLVESTEGLMKDTVCGKETMRRKIILISIAIIYIVVAALGIYLGHQKNRPQPIIKPSIASAAGPVDDGDTIVFVTRDGLWYHRAACRELRESRIPAKLSVARNYCRPCTKCRPQR
jgi:hypothetical protein